MPELFLKAKGVGERRGGKKLIMSAIEQSEADPFIEEDALEASDAKKAGVASELGEDEYVLQLRALFHRAAFSVSAKAKLRAVAEVLFKD